MQESSCRKLSQCWMVNQSTRPTEWQGVERGGKRARGLQTCSCFRLARLRLRWGSHPQEKLKLYGGRLVQPIVAQGKFLKSLRQKNWPWKGRQATRSCLTKPISTPHWPLFLETKSNSLMEFCACLGTSLWIQIKVTARWLWASLKHFPSKRQRRLWLRPVWNRGM